MSSKLISRNLKCVRVSHFYTFCLTTERFQRCLVCDHPSSNDNCGRALGSIFDDGCALLQGASLLRASFAKSYKKCRPVVEIELQEADMCPCFTFFNVLSNNGAVPTQPCRRSHIVHRQLRTVSGSIFDDSCALLQGASLLRDS